ncbi:MAG: ATP-dependent helicase, partial [Propionibacteriaceae bacterium]|nr:ATP-dependent helicase [Propionibacteriaceae bacterium]
VGQGRGHPVAAVGDPRQAIYGWRGAASDNMGDFPALFPMAEGGPPPVFSLTINRRSGEAVVVAANQIDARMDDSGGDNLLQVDPSRPPARIEAATFDTWPDEVAAIASRLVQARRGGEAPAWRDMAVLLRRNLDIPPFYKALTDLGVPVEIVGLGGLLALPEIAAVVALLHLAADDGDNPAAAQLVSGPACGLGPRDMAALARRARELRGGAGTLVGAIFDPGEGVSAPGRERLQRLGSRIKAMRRQRHESAVELVRIAVELIGLGAELDVPSAWSESIAPQVRRFVSHVADHGAATGVTLPNLLRWLADEAAFGSSLDQATPSQDDSVKLLTVHKAKGLEWQVVALPGLAEGVFPNDRVGDNPLTNPAVLPPRLGGVSRDDLVRFVDDLKCDQALSEDRLSYVATSRAKSLLLASAACWRPGAVKPKPPSRLFRLLAEIARQTGGSVFQQPPSDANPLALAQVSLPWPSTLPEDEQLRLDALAQAVAEAPDELGDAGLSAEDAQRVATWRVRIAQLEAPPARPEVPGSLSASALLLGHRDPAAFFAGLARPMPRLVDEGVARGIAFHRWVEQRFDELAPLDPPAADIGDLVSAFESGPYADRRPLAVEAPFVAVIAGQQVRGRIDAVYAGQDGFRYQLVDWKTSAGLSADPTQLAIYRLAWAQAMGCAVTEVDAVFYYVGQGKVVRPDIQGDVGAWMAALRHDEEKGR